MQSATHLAHKSSLSVRCLFSISFVWILGTRVIHFKVKTRQRDQKKKSLSFPQIFFPNLPWNPQPPPGRPETPCWPACTREGTWADWVLQEGGLFRVPPPCHSLCAGSQFCSQWDLYLTPRVLDREHRRKGRVSSPSFHPVSFTPSTLGTTRV